MHKLLNMYLAREKRSCSAIVRKTISYEWDVSRDGRSILFQMLEQRTTVSALDRCIIKIKVRN